MRSDFGYTVCFNAFSFGPGSSWPLRRDGWFSNFYEMKWMAAFSIAFRRSSCWVIPAFLLSLYSIELSGEEARSRPLTVFHRSPRALHQEAVTQSWASFLGPSHNGVSGETHLQKDWSASGPACVWERRVGTGYAAPAVSDNRLVYFHRLGDEERVDCLHPESGKLLWSFGYASDFKDRFGYNNGPRASPVISQGRVFVYGAACRLSCLALETGKLIWKKDLAAEYGLKQGYFGNGTTPLIHENILVVNIGAPGGPCVLGLDVKEGRELWRFGKQWGASYASPVPATINHKQRIFVFAGGERKPPVGGLLCLDPRNGALDFRFPWRSKKAESVNASNPVVVGSRIFVSASYGAGGVQVEVGKDFSCKKVWRTEHFGAHWNTPIYRNGFLYGFDGRHRRGAELVCINWSTGKEVWRKKPRWKEASAASGGETVEGGFYRGSLLWADGYFLCLGESGHLAWLALNSKGYRERARARLFEAPETWTLPVLSRGLLYVVQNAKGASVNYPRLLCYDLRSNK